MPVLGVLSVSTVIGMVLVSIFVESRFFVRKTAWLISMAVVLMIGTLSFLAVVWGEDIAVQFYTLVVHLPAFILFTWIGRYRGWRLLFQLLSAILFCFFIQHGAALVYYLSGFNTLAWIVSYSLFSVAVIYFVWHYLRPMFRKMLWEVHHGWGLMCLVLGAYYGITLYLIPGYAGTEQSSTVLKVSLSLMMAGVYTLLMIFFSVTHQETESRNSAQMEALQISALKDRIAAMAAAEDEVRIERHNLRHQLQTIAELIRKGCEQEALNVISSTQCHLHEAPLKHWCQPPVIDAMFSFYFGQAEQKGIQVQADISLPDCTPVDETELSIVFANAIENAIHANMALPVQKRCICCKIICRPALLFEISYPFAGEIRFDENGFPIACEEGHGLGTKTIANFCEKYSAFCQYEAVNGRFSLRVVL